MSSGIVSATTFSNVGSVDAEDSDADDGSESDGEKSGEERTQGVNKIRRRMMEGFNWGVGQRRRNDVRRWVGDDDVVDVDEDDVGRDVESVEMNEISVETSEMWIEKLYLIKGFCTFRLALSLRTQKLNIL